MNDQEKIAFKNNLKQYCHSIIVQRIDAAKKAITNAQEAANNEEKSSAGDKYETSRAMGHLEKDMYARQLAENIKELAGLHDINTGACYTEAMPGAFIRCSSVLFFIATGLGRHTVAGQEILFLSPNAPLSGKLLRRKTGDHFQFNGAEYEILDVF